MTWLRPGTVVGDRYEVEDLLGEGGMGVVMRARHRFTGERVALKMLHTHLSMRPDLAARFLAEARAPAAIGHPGIVRVLDAGTAQNGEPYFAMELLEGEPLAAAIRRGPMPFERIRRICLEILGALGAAHAAGFIHRDLKPENVFLTASGQVKLLDFGIAKSLGDLESQSHTATGTSMGTLHYMSPEQLKNAKRVDHRTDLWAVGVIFYQMVTGQLPYFAESAGDMLLLTLSSPPRPLEERLAEVPPALVGCLACALAVDPNARFASAGEMAAGIASIPPLVLYYHTGVVSQDSAPYHPVPPTMTAGPAITVTATASPAPPVARNAALIAAGALLLIVVVPIASGLVFWLSSTLQGRVVGGAAEQAVAQGRPCAVACKRINDCGAVFDLADCTAWCEGSPHTRECVKGADCTTIGNCFIAGYCDGKKPGGSRSCRQVAENQSKCALGNKDCGCLEMQEVSPSEADKLVINNSCAFTTCKRECMGDSPNMERCKFCYATSCRKQIAACREAEPSP